MTELALYLDPVNLVGWIIGGAVHLFWSLKEESKAQGRKVTLADYRNARPYKVETGMGLSLIAYLGAAASGQMNVLVAIACGYMGDSMAKKFMNTVMKR
ncbi:MAG: hypothetical protein SV201_05715 [Pseudomonadota bacterium]|nr:hypothetical protein [Pseudomonadota bacterium]